MGGTCYHQASRAGALGVSKGEDAEAGGMGAPKLTSLMVFLSPALLLRTLYFRNLLKPAQTHERNGDKNVKQEPSQSSERV